MTTTRPLWAFDDSPIDDPFGFGDRAVNFIEHLRHPLSTEPHGYIRLPRFWKRIIKRIYGPRHPDGSRVVKRVLMMGPRGSRKSSILPGACGLLHSIGPERVKLGQVVLGSGSKDQSRFGFDEAVGMVQATPGVEGKVNLRGEYIEHIADESKLRIVSSAGDITSSGSTPTAAFIDEFQYFRDRELIKSLRTGLPKRPNTLWVICMNSGSSQVGPAWEEYQRARKIALGERDAPHYLPILFEPEPDDLDPFDEEMWHRVNPGLAEGWPDLEEMRIAAAEAREKPAELREFKQLNLGYWTDSAVTPFVEMSVYDEGNLPEDAEALAASGEPAWLADMAERNVPCWIGVDLANKRDLTAIVAVWRDGDRFYSWAWFFAPEENFPEREAKAGGAPFSTWREEGYIDVSGNVTDYTLVDDLLRDLCGVFNVQEIAFDPALARDPLAHARDANLPVFEFPQNARLMIEAIADLERAITDRRFRHGGHPLLRWCFQNAEVGRTRLGQEKALQKGSNEWRSIDGAVAAAMAINRASQPEEADWFSKFMAYEKAANENKAEAA